MKVISSLIIVGVVFAIGFYMSRRQGAELSEKLGDYRYYGPLYEPTEYMPSEPVRYYQGDTGGYYGPLVEPGIFRT